VNQVYNPYAKLRVNECFGNDTPLAREMEPQGVSFEGGWNVNVLRYNLYSKTDKETSI
jgi:hypothetical protein